MGNFVVAGRIGGQYGRALWLAAPHHLLALYREPRDAHPLRLGRCHALVGCGWAFPLAFNFLEAGKTYEATIYADAEDADYKTNPQAYNIYKEIVTTDSVLPISMARGGGFAISLEEKL